MVKPLRKGSKESSKGASAELTMSSEPARVEIAIAPMLIQYGGDRSPGDSAKNV